MRPSQRPRRESPHPHPCVACRSQDEKDSRKNEKPGSPEPPVGYRSDECERWKNVDREKEGEQFELTARENGYDRQENRGQNPSNSPARNCDLPDDESRRPRQDQPESQQRFKGKRVVAHRRNDGGCRRRMEQFSHRVDCPERPEACTSLGDEFSRRLRQCGGLLKINRPNEKCWFVPGKRRRCRWERRWAQRSHPHPPIDCRAVSPDYKDGNWKREDCGQQQVHEAPKNEKPAMEKLCRLIHWKGARSSVTLSPRVHTRFQLECFGPLAPPPRT